MHLKKSKILIKKDGKISLVQGNFSIREFKIHPFPFQMNLYSDKNILEFPNNSLTKFDLIGFGYKFEGCMSSFVNVAYGPTGYITYNYEIVVDKCDIPTAVEIAKWRLKVEVH